MKANTTITLSKQKATEILASHFTKEFDNAFFTIPNNVTVQIEEENAVVVKTSPEKLDAILLLIKDGNRTGSRLNLIPAIKLYRELTGAGLFDAKQAIEKVLPAPNY
jgi:ribosomal protein L7/L12